MFSASGLLPAILSGKLKTKSRRIKGASFSRDKWKKKSLRKLEGCKGVAITLGHRNMDDQIVPNPYGYACSLRCRHPQYLKSESRSSCTRGKSEDVIPEHIYRKYTETDSRPISPEFSRRSLSLSRGRSIPPEQRRRCLTPEPETKQCQFHHRRILILDLRRVKSVDALGRQGSRTSGTSIDSTYGDDDPSSSMLLQFSPRHLSLSRSSTPKLPKGLKKLKEKSSSPTNSKSLEGLALPPLHSTVLSLLGGDRNENRAGQGQQTASTQDQQLGALRHKKLRRHARSKHKLEQKEQEQETLVHPREEGEEEEGEDENEEENLDENVLSKFQENLNTFKESKKALYYVVDDYFLGKSINRQEMKALDDQIQLIQQDFQKLETVFQTKNINLKESLWLNCPRTWSRKSATFHSPTDTSLMKDMSPMSYLEGYARITDARKHLYSLIYQRQRIIENPTKDWIWVKTLQPALSEVLGRPFRTVEMEQLCKDYLGLDPTSQTEQIRENSFLGIGAFCERIYGDYSLEDNEECFECSKAPNKHKYTCHELQKDNLESSDLTYMYGKVKDGEVQTSLSNIILALCAKD